MLTLSGSKDALFFVTMLPASEKSLSQGTEVAGVPRYLRAKGASCP